MKPSQYKEALQTASQLKMPLMVWGAHGIGKSQITRAFCKDRELGFRDFRLSQIEETDLRGLPKDVERDGRLVTAYLPPEDLPHEGQGLLFLDELNRASDPVLQSVFQLITERRLGSYRLPDGWTVVSACNFAGADYQVNNLDDALFDRFCHVVLETTSKYVEEWTDWLVGKEGTDEHVLNVIQFTTQSKEHLFAPVTEDIGHPVHPSPRSWSWIPRIERTKASKAVKRILRAGWIGTALALAYEKEALPISAKDIIKGPFSKVKPVLDDLNRGQRTALAHGVGSLLKEVKAKQADNVADFIEYLCENDPDSAVMAISRIVQDKAALGRVTALNPAIAAILGERNPLLAAIAKREKLYGRIRKIAGIQK